MRRLRLSTKRSIFADKSFSTASQQTRGGNMKKLSWMILVCLIAATGLLFAQGRSGRGGPAQPAQPLNIDGKWSGTWSTYNPNQPTNQPNVVCAKLDANVVKKGDVWEASFEGDCGRQYKYNIKMEGRQAGNAVL